MYNWMQKEGVVYKVSATYQREMEDKWTYYTNLGYTFCPKDGWNDEADEADIEDAFVSKGEAEYGGDVYDPTLTKYVKA